jgi:hypothetical protein
MNRTFSLDPSFHLYYVILPSLSVEFLESPNRLTAHQLVESLYREWEEVASFEEEEHPLLPAHKWRIAVKGMELDDLEEQ